MVHASEVSGAFSAYPSETYGDIIARDVHPPSDFLHQGPAPDLGSAPISVDRYIDPAFALREARTLWRRCWQMACREEELPQPGAFHVYEVADLSALVVRQEDGSIQAFWNSCPHRGRKIASDDGCRSYLRCQFHGLSWTLDGAVSDNPMAWDFPQWADHAPELRRLEVATWRGFVFVRFEPGGPDLTTILGPMDEHFAAYDLEHKTAVFHIQKEVRANWKVVAEAFMESHHSVTTHPQILPYIADINSQYDILNDYVSRQFSAQLVTSPLSRKAYSQREIVELLLSAGGRMALADVPEIPDDVSARQFMADFLRSTLSKEDGYDYSHASDAEMIDALLYNLFPNFSIWASHAGNLVYRWRPLGLDPALSVMDIYLLRRNPKTGPRLQVGKAMRIGADIPIGEAGPAGGMPPGLANIFEQDMQNIPMVQQGLHSAPDGTIEFARYSEMRLRKMHHMIDQFMEAPSSNDLKSARTLRP